MYVRTASLLPYTLLEEGLIKPDTIYKVIRVIEGTSQIDVCNESRYFLSAGGYIVINFKDYIELCSK